MKFTNLNDTANYQNVALNITGFITYANKIDKKLYEIHITDFSIKGYSTKVFAHYENLEFNRLGDIIFILNAIKDENKNFVCSEPKNGIALFSWDRTYPNYEY